MAKAKSGGKGNGKAKPPSEPVKPSETLLMPNTNDVRNLARRCKQMQKQSREASGQMGEAIAKAVEEKHLDRTAFSMARRLDGMSDEKLAITLPHLRRYIDDLELDKRATAQAQMFEEEGAEEGAEPGKLKVVGGRETAEAAGAS